MTDEVLAVSGTRRSYKELADGTLRVQIDVDPPMRTQFLRLFPEIGMPVALAPLAKDFERVQQAPPKKNDYGAEAQELWQSGFFRTPQVWHAVGTDEEYVEWVQKQKSCVSGRYSEYVNGVGHCEAAHVRRAAEAGTGYKPLFAVIPLTHDEHALQHQEGEARVLEVYKINCQPEYAKEWFDKQRILHVQRWAWERLRTILGAAHWNEIHPAKLCKWANKHEVYQYLPSVYKGWNDDSLAEKE